MNFARCNSNSSLLVLFTIGLVHNAGTACAVINFPNIFSWLLWLLIGFYLVWATWRLIGSMLTNRFSHSLIVNFRLFK